MVVLTSFEYGERDEIINTRAKVEKLAAYFKVRLQMDILLTGFSRED